MKKILIMACAVLFLLVSGIFAQNVNRNELERNQANINFINYEGPHSRIDTLEQIRNIGVGMGQAIKNGATQAGTTNRYFVIHCVSGPEGNKLDADVFGLGVDVQVDHIRNLRLIIQGYLQGAYDFSAGDAALLARYITIYNAVFRGDWAYYNSRYKNLVIQNMVSDKAGLSIRFDEWPGQTLMTIPLGTGNPGDLSALDTTALTDPKVTESMRQGDDRGIGDRQDMVDLKEREADAANQSATIQREAIVDEEKNITRDREDNTSTRQRVEQEQRQTQQNQQRVEQQQRQTQQDQEAGRITQQEAQKTQDDLAKQQRENEQKQQELAKQQEEAAKRDAEIAAREKANEEAKKQAEATQARSDQKTAEAQQERQDIAKDQQEMIDQKNASTVASAGTDAGTGTSGTAQTPAAAANPADNPNLLAVSILMKEGPLGRLVRVNPGSGALVQQSQMNTVNARTVTLLGGKILAIAGIERGNGAVRIVELSPDTLEMIKQGDDDLNTQSLLWNDGSSLYAVAVQDGKNYLARFDTNLVKQVQTSVEVHPYASCVFQGGKLLTQKADGTPLLLNPQTLK